MTRREKPDILPYNRPFMVGTELERVAQALAQAHLAGNGAFTVKCQELLTQRFGLPSLLTHSCTAALELATLLLEVGPGDEVIVPSFTFVSTAAAVVLRGGTPVFVDVDPRSLNVDPEQVEAAITDKTVGIIVVHYAGIACDMAALESITQRHGVWMVEDAAHCFGATYRGRLLGTFGSLATLSFHETKNISAGEGGALLIRDETLLERAEILWEKGTNRKAFMDGRVDKYSWVDVGSSFLPSDLSAAFLSAQLEVADSINARRLSIWHAYHEAFASLEEQGLIRRPHVPGDCEQNGHIYYLLAPSAEDRTAFLAGLRELGITAIFHYVPLHSSDAGRRFGRSQGELPVTVDIASRLLRLPLWVGMTEDDVDRVVAAVHEVVAATQRQVSGRPSTPRDHAGHTR